MLYRYNGTFRYNSSCDWAARQGAGCLQYSQFIKSGQADTTELHKLDGFNDRNLLSHSSGGWEFNVKVFIGLLTSEGSKILKKKKSAK